MIMGRGTRFVKVILLIGLWDTQWSLATPGNIINLVWTFHLYVRLVSTAITGELSSFNSGCTRSFMKSPILLNALFNLMYVSSYHFLMSTLYHIPECRDEIRTLVRVWVRYGIRVYFKYSVRGTDGIRVDFSISSYGKYTGRFWMQIPFS